MKLFAVVIAMAALARAGPLAEVSSPSETAQPEVGEEQSAKQDVTSEHDEQTKQTEPLVRQFTITIPELRQTQYQSFGDQGRYSFGYAYPDQMHTETRSEDGVVNGAYFYTDPNGFVNQVQYIADQNGFRVTANNLPMFNPQTVEDTPEVAEAKRQHARIWESIANHNRAQAKSSDETGQAAANNEPVLEERTLEEDKQLVSENDQSSIAIAVVAPQSLPQPSFKFLEAEPEPPADNGGLIVAVGPSSVENLPIAVESSPVAVLPIAADPPMVAEPSIPATPVVADSPVVVDSRISAESSVNPPPASDSSIIAEPLVVVSSPLKDSPVVADSPVVVDSPIAVQSSANPPLASDSSIIAEPLVGDSLPLKDSTATADLPIVNEPDASVPVIVQPEAAESLIVPDYPVESKENFFPVVPAVNEGDDVIVDDENEAIITDNEQLSGVGSPALIEIDAEPIKLLAQLYAKHLQQNRGEQKRIQRPYGFHPQNLQPVAGFDLFSRSDPENSDAVEVINPEYVDLRAFLLTSRLGDGGNEPQILVELDEDKVVPATVLGKVQEYDLSTSDEPDEQDYSVSYVPYVQSFPELYNQYYNLPFDRPVFLTRETLENLPLSLKLAAMGYTGVDGQHTAQVAPQKTKTKSKQNYGYNKAIFSPYSSYYSPYYYYNYNNPYSYYYSWPHEAYYYPYY